MHAHHRRLKMTELITLNKGIMFSIKVRIIDDAKIYWLYYGDKPVMNLIDSEYRELILLVNTTELNYEGKS